MYFTFCIHANISGGHFTFRLRAVSLFSWSVEQNARDTQMTRRVTEGARRERHDKRETTRKARENSPGNGLSRSSDFFGIKTVVLTDQARVRVCLNNWGFPTFLFLKSAAYAVHRVKVDSKLIDWANLNFWGHEAALGLAMRAVSLFSSRAAALVSRVWRLRRSTLARACTPFTKS